MVVARPRAVEPHDDTARALPNEFTDIIVAERADAATGTVRQHLIADDQRVVRVRERWSELSNIEIRATRHSRIRLREARDAPAPPVHIRYGLQCMVRRRSLRVVTGTFDAVLLHEWSRSTPRAASRVDLSP